MKNYDELPFLPGFMARLAAEDRGLSPAKVERFSNIVDRKCRAAYAAKGDNFFKRCVRSQTNCGRDTMLQTWIPHWLDSFQDDPDKLDEYAR